MLTKPRTSPKAGYQAFLEHGQLHGGGVGCRNSGKGSVTTFFPMLILMVHPFLSSCHTGTYKAWFCRYCVQALRSPPSTYFMSVLCFQFFSVSEARFCLPVFLLSLYHRVKLMQALQRLLTQTI